MGAQPEGQALVPGHGRAPPHRRRREDDAVHLGRAGAGHGDHDHGAPHALAKQIEGHPGMAPAHGFGDRLEVVGIGPDARPQSGLPRLPEAALVVGVGGDSLGRQEGPGVGEEIAVIVEPVQGDDDRPGRPVLRHPGAQRQLFPVGGEETVRRQGRPGDGGTGRVHPRRAGGDGHHGHEHGDEQQRRRRPPCAPSPARARRHGHGVSSSGWPVRRRKMSSRSASLVTRSMTVSPALCTAARISPLWVLLGG